MSSDRGFAIETVAGEASAHGAAMIALIRDLYPLHRSLTGRGLRETLRRMSDEVPLTLTEVPSGTRVFDWTVPDEWTIDDAWIENADGRRVVDYTQSNLHVVAYSEPVDAVFDLEELRPRLHSLPAHPDWIPWRNSYYARSWGFCLSDRTLRSLPDGRYRAVIRSRIAPGSMTLGEWVHPGERPEEVLIFAHTCHPSLANDNLSAIAVALEVARHLRGRRTRFTYRFVFAPATIGSIAWMALNEAALGRLRHGLVLAMLGTPGPIHYKESRSGDALVDRAGRLVLRAAASPTRLLPFSPWGFDERQFATPGINAPVGSLTRAIPGEFAEEHTSADDVALMSQEALGESWLACLRILDVIERDGRYLNLSPKGEPQLGRRGLYRNTGGYYESLPERNFALLWVLNQSDGNASLVDIAERSGLAFDVIAHAADELVAAGLLAPVGLGDAGAVAPR